MKFRQLWNLWLRVAKVVGEFQARLILTIFYYFVMGPFALCLRIFSDPMRLKIPKPLTWLSVHTLAEKKFDAARRQF